MHSWTIIAFLALCAFSVVLSETTTTEAVPASSSQTDQSAVTATSVATDGYQSVSTSGTDDSTSTLPPITTSSSDITRMSVLPVFLSGLVALLLSL